MLIRRLAERIMREMHEMRETFETREMPET